MMEEKHDWKREDLYSRQTDIFNPMEKMCPVTIVGAGGIGSPVGLALGKLGIQKITVIDDDRVETHNLPNQIYPMDSVGRQKVDAFQNMVEQFSEAKVHPMNWKWNGDVPRGIVVSAIDNMEGRKKIFESVRYKPQVQLLIDGRMGGEFIRLYSIRPCDPDDLTFYETTLYSDEEAVELPCTARAVIYTSFFVGAFVARAVAKFLKDGEIRREIVFDAKTLLIV